MQVCIGKLLESLVSEWYIALKHINIKQIQSAQFQADLENPNVHILQIDFATSCYCKCQNEIQSTLWNCQIVMCFIAALTYKSVCKAYLIVSDSHDKGNDTVVVFIDFL